MARTWAGCVAFLGAVLFVLLEQSAIVHGDKRWFEAYEQMVDDVSSLVDWNETIPLLPGYDCFTGPGFPAPGEEFYFPCEILPPSDEIPTSAHLVRPADIKVIAAMGDSLTAANGAGACLLPELIYMYRGLTFSHGGDGTFETNPSLANILRKYNPNLKGYGVRTGNWDSDESNMNVGYPGDKANDMPHQARWLVDKMKAKAEIDFENDWKVVTLFIGGNDLCDWCDNPYYYSADNYVNYIHEALMTLHDEMPRTIVNVVGILQVYQVDILRAPICNFFHWAFCQCGMFLTENELKAFEEINIEYQVKMEEAILSGQYDTKDDFTVVLQPFLHNTSVPFKEDGTPDFSYFAPDCFHFSAKGHAQGGMELWNNMIEPVGAKRTSWNPGSNISCPTEAFPYIYTNLNSRGLFTNPPPTEDSGRACLVHTSLTFVLMVASLTLVVLGILGRP
ncbi:phospholipase B1, membrane-associated-like [Diadema setosum]|uniref:phospholipase B1, membrane-associated-like n=1 Tax=Diadema setosum TaxID=31175 RepID=UPI003B3B7A88